MARLTSVRCARTQSRLVALLSTHASERRSFVNALLQGSYTSAVAVLQKCLGLTSFFRCLVAQSACSAAAATNRDANVYEPTRAQTDEDTLLLAHVSHSLATGGVPLVFANDTDLYVSCARNDG